MIRRFGHLSMVSLWLLGLLTQANLVGQEPDVATFTIERAVAHSGFDGEMCWVHARAGAVPAEHTGNASDNPLVVMTMQKLLLSGSDVFYAINQSQSRDLGRSWSEPEPIEVFRRKRVTDLDGDTATLPTGASIAPALLQIGDETTVCDFTPKWHAASQRLLGIGHTVWYRDNRVMHVRPRGVAYAVYDPRSATWSDWKMIELPNAPEFKNAGAGSAQRVDLANGEVLVPIYFKRPDTRQFSVTVCRCTFDGEALEYVEHGDVLSIDNQRGLYEPSLTHFDGRFYLTMRNDEHGYVSVGDDGLHFSTPRRWQFDDGSDLGNYNTQQHWVTHSDGLFLTYTRRGADNDHVFRHRAPLFIARVDSQSLQVIRSSEQILVPERGARLGNFGVVEVSPTETWVTAAEWMQPQGVAEHGSDNRVFVAKLKFDHPNRTYFGPLDDTVGDGQ